MHTGSTPIKIIYVVSREINSESGKNSFEGSDGIRLPARSNIKFYDPGRSPAFSLIHLSGAASRAVSTALVHYHALGRARIDWIAAFDME